MKLRLALASLALASPAWGAETIVPQLETTSGSGAAALLDGDRATGWSPAGDPEDEGISFRFLPFLAVNAVRVVSCPASPSFTVQAFANGRRVGAPLAIEPGSSAQVTFPSRFKADAKETIRLDDLFLRIDDAAGTPCVGEVVFEHAGGPLEVVAPRVIYARASASSQLDSHSPAHAFDGKPLTSWMESSKGTGAGEWIELTLSRSVTAGAIEIWNGRQSKQGFPRNPRVKKLAVITPAGKQTFSVKDKMESQRLTFPEAVTSSSFRFSIADAFPGNKKKDLALSEIALMGEEGAIALSFEEPALEKKLGLPFTDRQRVSYCAKQDGARRRFKVRAAGTIAAWDEAETGAVWSLLGTWKLGESAAPWTAIEIAGESRSTEPDSERDATKAVNAKLEIARVQDLGLEGFRAALARLSNAAAVSCIANEGIDSAYRLLIEGDAIVVRGAALDDVLWRTRR